MDDFLGAEVHDENPLQGFDNPDQPPALSPIYHSAFHIGRRHRIWPDLKESPLYVLHIQAGQSQKASATVLLLQLPRLAGYTPASVRAGQ